MLHNKRWWAKMPLGSLFAVGKLCGKTMRCLPAAEWREREMEREDKRQRRGNKTVVIKVKTKVQN